jgi:hypothetical protein
MHSPPTLEINVHAHSLAVPAALALLAASPCFAQRILTGTDTGNPSLVVLRDGINLGVIQSFQAFPGFMGGVRVALGDVNGDGVADIVAGAGPGGTPRVRVFDGVTGAGLADFLAFSPSFTGGVFVAAGDVTGDGLADLVVGADAGGAPQVSLFRAPDWAPVGSFLAFAPGFTGGVRVAAGDVNADARADIIAGAGAGGAPQVSVFSGANQGLLVSFLAYPVAFTGGVFVAAGDLNGDDRADIITGSGSGAPANVKAFDGVNQNVLANFFAFPPGFTGGVAVGAGKVNGDGVPDILAGAGIGGNAEVRAFDGATMAQFQDFPAYGPPYTGGVFVAGPGIGPATPVALQSFSVE